LILLGRENCSNKSIDCKEEKFANGEGKNLLEVGKNPVVFD